MGAPYKARILLVDDEEQLRRLVARTLERRGYEVVSRCNGLEAVAYGSREDAGFDLAVLDIMMPGMTGDQAYERLRSLNPQARFVFMTGFTDDQIWRRLSAESDVRCLRKPFRAAELISVVEEMLGDDCVHATISP